MKEKYQEKLIRIRGVIKAQENRQKRISRKIDFFYFFMDRREKLILRDRIMKISSNINRLEKISNHVNDKIKKEDEKRYMDILKKMEKHSSENLCILYKTYIKKIEHAQKNGYGSSLVERLCFEYKASKEILKERGLLN